jgi:hypothetical protein
LASPFLKENGWKISEIVEIRRAGAKFRAEKSISGFKTRFGESIESIESTGRITGYKGLFTKTFSLKCEIEN